MLALLAFLAGGLLYSPPATAASFTGRWLSDLSSQKLPERPDIYLVADGHYDCRSCTPPRSYPADGKPHSVPGDAELESESVTVLSPRSIRTSIVSPSLIRETTMTVSIDGSRASYVSLDRRPDVSGVLRTRYLARRVAPAAKGANRVSGSWQGIAYLEVPKQVRTIALRVVGNSFTYRTPTGVKFSAAIDGAPALVHGPYAGQITASIRRSDANTLVEARKRDGKLLFERTYRLSRDGKSLAVTTRDATTGTSFSSTSHRF